MPTFKCDICTSIFSSRKGLIQHQNLYHLETFASKPESLKPKIICTPKPPQIAPISEQMKELLDKNQDLEALNTKLLDKNQDLEALNTELTAKNKWFEDLTDKLMQCKKIQVNLTVPKQLKNKIWLNTFGEQTNGLCYCCGLTKLHITHFEAGHIISKAQGGDLSEENLRPVCSACNKGTSFKNMKDYARIVFPKTSKLLNFSANNNC
jgi:5-methylcytosine-specific restriction endonuclease McrA